MYIKILIYLLGVPTTTVLIFRQDSWDVAPVPTILRQVIFYLQQLEVFQDLQEKIKYEIMLQTEMFVLTTVSLNSQLDILTFQGWTFGVFCKFTSLGFRCPENNISKGINQRNSNKLKPRQCRAIAKKQFNFD